MSLARNFTIAVFCTLFFGAFSKNAVRAEGLAAEKVFRICEQRKNNDMTDIACTAIITSIPPALQMGVGIALASTKYKGTDTAWMAEAIPKTLGFCFPDNLTNPIIVDVVIQHMERHPNERHFAIEYVVWSALRSAYPCNK